MDSRTERGFHWPENDQHCAKVIFESLGDLSFAIKQVGLNNEVAVQAGGNCGVWPAFLANHFEWVYTFEPDIENFRHLVRNVPNNVIASRAALGSEPAMADISRVHKNCGASYIDGAGNIPVTTLDIVLCDPRVKVGFIALDVEGYELNAIMGARRLIDRCSPIIQFEDKGLSERYGYQKGAAKEWLVNEHNYEALAKINNDIVMGPKR